MTANDVIDALGGTGATAEIFGVQPSAVSNWRAADAFPQRLYFHVWEVCQERGIDWAPPSRTVAKGAA